MIESVAHNFHFLRPVWLLALLPGLWLVWHLARRSASYGAWEKVVDAHLLRHLVRGTETSSRQGWISVLGAAWAIATLALAGPTWSKLPQAVYRAEGARVIVLSLAPTMDATDVAPSRIARARLKVLDMLNQQREGQVALIAYSGEPHVVSPLTEDAKTIAAMVPVLTTDLMPVAGDRLGAALNTAGDVLAHAGVLNGEIIVVADGTRDAPAGSAAAELRARGHRVSVLAIGTRDGAPIPQSGGGFLKDASGAIVIPKLDERPLRQLVSAGGGRFALMSADDSDLAQLLVKTPATASDEHARRVDGNTERWRDEGPWLLLVLLPLVALLFRRGWLIAGVIFIAGMQPDASYATTFSDMWLRKDQQAQSAMKKQDYARAAELYEDPLHKGEALYRAQRYDDAAAVFGEVKSADGFYNRGNALAKAGHLQDALAAYQDALRLIPNHEDARYNKALVEKMLEHEPQQSQSQQSKGSANKNAAQNSTSNASNSGHASDQHGNPQHDQKQATQGARQDKSKQDEATDNAAQKSDAQQQARANDARQDAQAADTQQANDAAKTRGDARAATKQDGQPQSETQRENAQAMEQWLGRVADDPGGLLREKFRRQHLRRAQHGAEQ